jgi:hypothetical protein
MVGAGGGGAYIKRRPEYAGAHQKNTTRTDKRIDKSACRRKNTTNELNKKVFAHG